MRISAKTRYALSAMIYLAQHPQQEECVTVLCMSEALKISKIYMEQVFTLLKKADLVISTKGAQGGYRLKRSPECICMYDILYATENTLFEKNEEPIPEERKAIEISIQKCIFDGLDQQVAMFLKGIRLSEVVEEVEKQSIVEGYMYYL